MTLSSVRAALLVASVAFPFAACGGEWIDPRFPARPEGCEVDVFHDQAPTVPTDNIGTVRASCTEITSNEDCLRTLKDQVCKLGGDVVWGVEPAPVMEGGKKHLEGRAAKTRSAKPVRETPSS
jgi:hypothetical protein